MSVKSDNIFVESGETSAQSFSSVGLMNTNYIPELTEIAKENISFSQSDLLEGAAVAPLCGWTIAGMVAETVGVPMKLYSTHNSKTNNSMNQYKTFMPGLISLGEILEEKGYHNYFMAGSDFDFGGRYDYCTQHGNYEIFDYNVAIEKEIIPFGYYVWWGFEDQILFRWAKEELTKIAEKDEPFNFSLSPFGYGVIAAPVTLGLIVIFVFLPVYCGKNRLRTEISWSRISLYGLLGMFVFVRLIVLWQHSWRHYFFTYRALSASILALCFIVLELIEPTRRKAVTTDA